MISEQFVAPGAPQSILRFLVAVEVRHLAFDGSETAGLIVVDYRVCDDVALFFAGALEVGFPIEKVIPANVYGWDDEAMMTDNDSSGYNYRQIAGSGQLSLHAFGRALDINPRQNPYIYYAADGKALTRPSGAVHNPYVAGALHAAHPLVELMRERGWEWGGDWTPAGGRVDYQHFQKARGSGR